MTRQEAIERLRNLQSVGDAETDHLIADETLCELLKSLGYVDVVEEYERIKPKWYS